MHSDEWIEKELKYQRDLLYRVLALLTKEGHEIEEIEQAVSPKLAFIKITFQGDSMALGPVKLTVGQKTKATILGFDQTGAAWTGAIPPATYSIDNSAVDSSTPDASNGDDIVSLADGVANLTASLTSAEGVALSDTETITNTAVVPVLSSVKIDFTTPA